MEISRKCVQCRKTFMLTEGYGTYCSENCALRRRQAQARYDANRKANAYCFQCGISYHKRSDSHKYCSFECFKKAHNETRQCPACNKSFTVKKSDPKEHCSIQCSNRALKSKNIPLKVCAFCGKGFTERGGKRLYCSTACAGKAKDRKQPRQCERCSKVFNPTKNDPFAKYCGKTCRRAAQNTKVKIVCQFCEKVFYVSPCNKERKYCSNSCYRSVKPPYRIFYEKLQQGIRTEIESKVEKALISNNVSYVWEKRFGRYWVDFYLPIQNIGIECDEPHWHNSEKDASKDAYIQERYRVKIVRYSTKQIKGNIEALISDLLNVSTTH